MFLNIKKYFYKIEKYNKSKNELQKLYYKVSQIINK